MFRRLAYQALYPGTFDPIKNSIPVVSKVYIKSALLRVLNSKCESCADDRLVLRNKQKPESQSWVLMRAPKVATKIISEDPRKY